MLAFACSQCRQPLRAPEDLAGKKVKCPRCGQPTPVPEPALATPPGPAAVPPPGDREAPPTLPPDPPAGPTSGDTHSDLARGSQEATSPGVTGDAPSELTEFLAPAQSPGELGRLGPYRVLKILGAGGMGVVFQAEDPQLQRLVALKVMLPTLAAGATARKRFLREAQAAAKLEHDHIVAIYHVGEDRGVPFLAMPFLQGESLDERVKRAGQLPPAEVLRVGRETAEGLAAAHAKGLIHRDIKPGNLWLQGAAGAAAGGRVKILDFGLAGVADESGQHLTQSGAILGTPAYMAPEQATGQKADARSDLFSLGCVLYRLATGALAFRGADTISTLMAVATESPRPPHEVNPAVPGGLSDLVMKLLAKKPEDRPADATAVVAAIRELEQDRTAVLAPPAPAAKKPAGPAPRRRRGWIAAAAVVLVGAGVGGYFVLNALDDEPAGSDDGGSALVKPPPERAADAQPQDKKPPAVPAAVGFDALRPDAIPARQLKATGWDEPGKRPPHLVAILGRRQKTDRAIAAVDVRPDGKMLALLTRDHAIHFMDVAARTRVGELPPEHDTPWPHLHYDPSGDLVAATGSFGAVNLWRTNPAKLLHRFPGAKGDGRLIAFGPAGSRLLALGRSGSGGGDVRLHSTATFREVRPLKFNTGRVTALAFSPDGRMLAASFAAAKGPNGHVKLWDVATGDVRQTLHGDRLNDKAQRQIIRPARNLAFSPDGKLLLTAHEYGTDAFLFDVAKGQARKTLAGDKEWVISATFSPDGRWIAVASKSGAVRLWDAQTLALKERLALGKPPAAKPKPPPPKPVVPPRRVFRRPKQDPRKESPKPVSVSPTAGPVRRVLFSPDGRYLLALHGAGLLSVFRLDDPANANQAAR